MSVATVRVVQMLDDDDDDNDDDDDDHGDEFTMALQWHGPDVASLRSNPQPK